MEGKKKKLDALTDKMKRLQNALRFQNQMQAQQSMLAYKQGQQQITNIERSIEDQRDLSVRKRNNLNANIMRENMNTRKYISDQVLGTEEQRADKLAGGIARQEALKNKLDADFEENTKNTKKGLLIAGGGAALLAALKGVGGVVGTVAGTLAPIFLPLLAIVAIIFAFKLIFKTVENYQEKKKITDAFDKFKENINNKNYIQELVKPYMDQLGQVDKDQHQAFQDMVGTMLKDAGVSKEYQDQFKQIVTDFAKEHGMENNEYAGLTQEQIKALINDLGKEMDQLSSEIEEMKKKEQKGKDADKESEKSNDETKDNSQSLGTSFAEAVIGPAEQDLENGIKKENKETKFEISGVNEGQGTSQPIKGGTKKKKEIEMG